MLSARWPPISRYDESDQDWGGRLTWLQMMRGELIKMGYNIEKKSYGLETIAQAPQQPPPVSRPIGGDSSTTLGMSIASG